MRQRPKYNTSIRNIFFGDIFIKYLTTKDNILDFNWSDDKISETYFQRDFTSAFPAINSAIR